MEAASCIPCAGGYVVVIENGVMRSLRTEDESEVQSVIHSRKKPAPYTTAPAAASEKASSDPGYAVMTRIRVVNHWTWATWMCFDTYAQAVAHARKGDKVVRFASAEWATLKHQESAAQPEQSDASPVHTTGRPTLPSRAEGEPFVEFVLRLLNTLDLAGTIPSEGQEDDRSASESDKQTSKIDTPAFVARLILNRLSKSEIGKLDRMLDEDLPALLDALRGRPRIVAKRRGRYQ